jgi:hypothetical protein
MKLFLIALIMILSPFAHAQKWAFNPDQKYHQDSLKYWTGLLMHELSIKHPGFYRYTTPENYKRAIDSTLQTLTDSINTIDYYRKLKPLIALVRCVHTGITLSEDHMKYLEGSATFLPLEVFIDSEKNILVAKCHGRQCGIPQGSQIISINGRSAKDILNVLLQSIPADGYIQSEKILVLNHKFAFWYQTIIEADTAYDVTCVINGKLTDYHLTAVSREVFPMDISLEKNYKEALAVEFDKDLATLTIHTFAKRRIKEGGQNFNKFVKHVFKELNDRGVHNLIIDLRYNTGGTDGNAARLASFFFEKPFAYWKSIEVTDAVARDIKGFYKLFFKKPVREGSINYWQKTWLTTEFDYYEEQLPAKNNFKGNVYILTNGLCMSSCGDFTAILSHNNRCLVFGQETGGTYQGNNSGMIPTVIVPPGLILSVPLMKYTNAVEAHKNIGRGTIPDHGIPLKYTDWISDGDSEMEYLKKWIRQ